MPACVHRASLPAVPSPYSSLDNSFRDLSPLTTVKIVLPLTRSGGYRVTIRADQGKGDTVTAAADDLLGYTTLRYLAAGKSGEVRLKWMEAQQTVNGQAIHLKHPPHLPFALPTKQQRIRLVYLLRASAADHNMAILGAKRLESLDAFTAKLKHEPAVCGTDDQVFCSFVPPGIAVRVE